MVVTFQAQLDPNNERTYNFIDLKHMKEEFEWFVKILNTYGYTIHEIYIDGKVMTDEHTNQRAKP